MMTSPSGDQWRFCVFSEQQLRQPMSQLLATQEELCRLVHAKVSESRFRQRRVAGSFEVLKICVADFVLVARVSRPGITPKLAATYMPPFRIVGIDPSGIQTVHVGGLQVYSESQLHETAHHKDVFQHACAQDQCDVVSIINGDKSEDNAAIVSVHWVGFGSIMHTETANSYSRLCTGVYSIFTGQASPYASVPHAPSVEFTMTL